MPQELHLAAAGLYTDPYSQLAPPGALRTGDNIVVRRTGIVQPRPGFKYVKAMYSTRVTYRAIPYAGDMVIYTSSPDVRWYSNLSQIVNESAAALTPMVENFRAAKDKKNLYLLTGDGVRKLTGALDAVAERAGAPRAGTLIFVAAVAGTAVLTNEAVRYRAVTRRKDANGNILRGTPSDQLYYINNDLGATAGIQIAYYLVGDEVAGDVVEFYRSAGFAAAAVPDEELMLCKELTLTAGHIAAGSAGFVDNLPEAELGAFLYTSPSQEGALQANFRPPYATDIALFHGSMFYAGAKLPQRKILKMQQAASGDLGATGVGYRLTTGDTHSNTTVDNVADTAGLCVGQYIGGTDIPDGTRIAAIAGSMITMTAAATSTNVGVALTFRDTITIGTSATNETFAVLGSTYFLAGSIVQQSSVYYAQSLSEDESYVYPGTEGYINVEKLDPSAAAFKIWGTNGSAYFPALIGPTWNGSAFVYGDADGVPSEQDPGLNWLTWSKSEQPEAVPEVNYALVGAANYKILRIIPTRDALFIFKEDGIWRLTGAGANSGWRIDEFDLSYFLLRPDCVVEMENAIYAWTNKGVVRVTDVGIERISEPAIGKDLRQTEQYLAYYTSELARVWLIKNEKDNELVLSTDYGGSNAPYYYVYNTRTQVWTRWYFGCVSTPSYLVSNAADNKMYLFSGTTSPEVDVERLDNQVSDISDREYTVTISAVSGTSITINAGSGWTPQRGDYIYKTGTYKNGHVIQATDSTHFTINRTGMTTGAATARAGIDCTIEWLAKPAGNPGVLKHFSEGSYAFEKWGGISELYFFFESSISATYKRYIEGYAVTLGLSTDYTAKPRTVRFVVPREHARVAYLFPKIYIRQAHAAFELAGLSLIYKVLAPRGTYRGDVSAPEPLGG